MNPTARWAFIASLLAALVMSVLTPVQSARAASAWDGYIVQGDPIVHVSGTGWDVEYNAAIDAADLLENHLHWDYTVYGSTCRGRRDFFLDTVLQNPDQYTWGMFQRVQADGKSFVILGWNTYETLLTFNDPSKVTVTGDQIVFTVGSDGNLAHAPIAYCPSATGTRVTRLDGGADGLSAKVVYVTDVNYPTGYQGIQIPQTWSPPTPTYVAMGDSFSSGEGNPPFESGTDNPGVNECHRSGAAYPRLLESQFGEANFVACSGATTDDVILNQMDALSEETETVTITIGGNDVGFNTFALNCVLVICSEGSQGYENAMEAINGDLQDSLETVYWTILGASGDATVYVMGYPYLTGDSANGACQTFEIVSDLGARAITDALNAKINSAVENVRDDVLHPDYASRLVYVPANSNDDSSPFDGNFICSSPSLYNDIDYSNQEYSFHPNSAGHAAYATLLNGS